MNHLIIPFSKLSMRDLPQVGGKNASLGEMIRNLSPLGIEVPDGYAVTVEAYNEFLSFNNISMPLTSALNNLDHKTLSNLSAVGQPMPGYCYALRITR